jgi:hypothetical protein
VCLIIGGEKWTVSAVEKTACGSEQLPDGVYLTLFCCRTVGLQTTHETLHYTSTAAEALAAACLYRREELLGGKE